MTEKIHAWRGYVYRMVIEPDTTMLCLIISANVYNRSHDSFVTVLVTADKRLPPFGGRLPSWVRLSAGDPVFGHVVCSDIGMVGAEELKENLGPLSDETMAHVDRALRNTLSL